MRQVAATCPVRLGSFLKLCGAAVTGGQAKVLIQEGAVAVNGAVEVRRGHLLRAGDEVSVAGTTYRLVADGPC